jgi:RimJ/RimL family protein N-acetyltransferase
MLLGQKAGLRARREADVAVLHAQLHDDVAGWSRGDSRPWRPVPVGSSPFAEGDPGEGHARFSVVRLADDELAGSALLWGIDRHHRSAHVGLALLPSARGQGLGTDVVGILCHYAFRVLGLHRLQIETLADNVAMARAATANGFVEEGTLSGSTWVSGSFLDDVIYGLLAENWTPRG